MMAISVVMPALELTQETGKLVSWRIKEGEAVAKGEAPPESTLNLTSGATVNTKIAQPDKAKAASPGDVVSRGKPKISPKARRIAGELNVNLNSVRGSGQDGEI